MTLTAAQHDALDAALYARNDNIRIGYKPRQGGATLEQIITVRKSGEAFYAMGGPWGCGKNARNVEGAVRMLLQDMATMIWMQIEPEAPLL